MNNSQRGSLRFYLVVILLALIAFAVGVWDVMIEREGGGWLIQISVAVVLIVILAGLYSRARRERIALEEEAAADAPEDDGSSTDRLES
jgi:uncharacterized membrane protein (DUF485 family)